jgi:hypothetical protein
MVPRDDHLLPTNEDSVGQWLAKSLRNLQKGGIQVDIEGQPTAKIRIVDNEYKILVDLIQPTFFRTHEDEIGIFDELKRAREFAQKLTDNGVTLSFLTSGKKAFTLGKEAKPRFSRLITRSRDIQIDNIRKAAKLKNDLR